MRTLSTIPLLIPDDDVSPTLKGTLGSSLLAVVVPGLIGLDGWVSEDSWPVREDMVVDWFCLIKSLVICVWNLSLDANVV